MKYNTDVQTRMITSKYVPDTSPETRNLAIDSADRSSLECIEFSKCAEYRERMVWPLQMRIKQMNGEAEVGMKLICWKLAKKEKFYA